MWGFGRWVVVVVVAVGSGGVMGDDGVMECANKAIGAAQSGNLQGAVAQFSFCVEQYGAALEESQPDLLGQLLFNEGLAREQMGDVGGAANVYARAASFAPSMQQVLVKAAWGAHATGRAKEAVGYLKQALALGGGEEDPKLLEHLGDALVNLKRFDEAVEVYERALQRVQGRERGGLYLRIGEAYGNMDQVGKALEAYDKGLNVSPRDLELLSARVRGSCEAVSWEGWDGRIVGIRKSLNKALKRISRLKSPPPPIPRPPHSPLSPYDSTFLPLPPKLHSAIATSHAIQFWIDATTDRLSTSRWRGDLNASLFTASPTPHTPKTPLAPTVPRLRVVLVSRRLHSYAGTHLMLDLFGSFDREKVELWCVASGPGDGGDERKWIAQDCDWFVDTSEGGRDGAAIAIASASPDIVLDYDGQHSFNNMATLAMRPADRFQSPQSSTPVGGIQVTFLGHAGPVNDVNVAPVIDWQVVDRWITPAESTHLSSPQPTLHLPISYQPQERSRFLPQVHTSACSSTDEEERLAPLTPAPPTPLLATYNRLSKFDPTSTTAWSQILRGNPAARLAVVGGDAEATERWLQELEARGVGRWRVEVDEKVSKTQHLVRHLNVTIWLDTKTYGGHTSAADALAAGTPVLTTPGRSFASRVATGLVHADGKGDWTIAVSWKDYVNRAITISQHPVSLWRQDSLYSCSSQQRNPNSTLFNPPLYANTLTSALRAAREAKALQRNSKDTFRRIFVTKEK